MSTSPDPSLSQSSGVLTIDLTALAENWRALARRAAPAQCAAAVKADAYGIGIEAAAPALHAAGCRHFFVAQLNEGTRVRAALAPRPQVRIYVLNGLQAGADLQDDYYAHGLAPVIGSEEELARWAASSARQISSPPCAVHIDTGMNRLGFASLGALKSAIDRYGRDTLGIDLLMSHFVSSEEPDNPLNALQIARFDDARRLSRASRQPRQFVGRLPQGAPVLRSHPPRLRALRRQSDARRAQSDEARRQPRNRDPAGALDRARRERRL
jgi:alanine racemase